MGGIKQVIMGALLLVFFLPGRGQTVRGSLLPGAETKSVKKYIKGGKIDLLTLRETTNFLTDEAIGKYDRYFIPRRRDAFIRHVKHMSEKLECHYLENNEVGPEQVELFLELELLVESLIQRARASTYPGPSFRKKVRMLRDSQRSQRILKYKIPKNDVDVDDPSASPFWHPPKDPDLHKIFGNLAEEKKIDPKKSLVVLFDESSGSGSAPKVTARDLDLDNEWVIKWGDEVHTDVVGSRVFAALGYDVDHPYFYDKNDLTLVFDEYGEIKNPGQLRDQIKMTFGIELSHFISEEGTVSAQMIKKEKDLAPFLGIPYVRFVKCAIEGRPDRVKRIGSFVPYEVDHTDRRELRGALLAQIFIDNWDTREENTLITTVHDGNYNYRISGVFSDLGTSLGVKYQIMPSDFKVGLVNELSWKAASRKPGKVKLHGSINEILPMYAAAEYEDLLWMAKKIMAIDGESLEKIVEKAGWPKPIEVLYFNKMASRRASILKAFALEDPHPIPYDRKLNYETKGILVIKKGKLNVEYFRGEHPGGVCFRKRKIQKLWQLG